MKLNVPRFLRVLGISVAPEGRGVNETRRGDARPKTAGFSARCQCPLHADSGFSMVASAATGGDAEFDCLDPRCRFHGDAVSLVSLAKGVTPAEAVSRFLPGGELAVALDEPLSSAEADAYASSSMTQKSLKAYLAKCSRAFLAAPERAMLSPGLSPSTPRHAPPGVGVAVEDQAASGWKFMEKAWRRQDDGLAHVVYPYTFDGDVTHILFDTPASRRPDHEEDCAVTRADIGVFGEDVSGMFIDGSRTRLVVCRRPQVAARIRSARSQATGRDDAAVVAANDFPLPQGFAGARSVVLLSTGDDRVTLSRALSAVCAKSLVAGVPASRQSVRVATVQAPSHSLPSSAVDRISSGALQSTDAVEWIADRLCEAVSRGDAAGAAAEFSGVSVPPSVAEAVRRHMEVSGVPAETAASAMGIVSEAASRPSPGQGDMSLANGRRVRALPRSVVAVHPDGRSDTLANVGIRVVGKTVSGNGGDAEGTLHVSVAADSPSAPQVDMDLSEADVSSPRRLQRAVSTAFALRGASPYVAFYSIPGYSWEDILGRMGDGAPVRREVSCLGMDDFSTVNFPGVSVSPDGTVSVQDRPPAVPAHVARVYGGVRTPPESAWEFAATRALLSGCSNMRCAAFACGILHAAHQAVCWKFDAEAGRRHARRHLLYVETEPGIWTNAFKAVADLLSGSDYTPTVPYTRAEQFLEGYSGLGTLPLVARVSSLGHRFPSVVDGSGVGLVGLVDSTTALSAAGKLPATYVVPCDETESAGGPLDVDVDAVRDEFPAMVSLLMRMCPDRIGKTASVPCLDAYRALCSELGEPESPVVGNIASSFFQGVGMSGASAFFDMLHYALIPGSSPRIRSVDGRPKADPSFTKRGQHVFVSDSEVVVSRMVVDVFNSCGKFPCRFDAGQLTEEMSSRGMLAPDVPGVSPDRVWCIKKEVWDAFVSRPPIEIGPVSGGQAV